MQASTLITPRLAEEAINSRLTCLPIESLPLTQCVGGTLRENIYAERDAPPYDRVYMDGIAVDSEQLRRGLRRFRVLRIDALRALGQTSRARSLAEQYLRQYPNDAHSARLRALLRDAPRN